MLHLAASLLIGAAPSGDAINAVLGDESWLATHGARPADAPAEERITVHLAYVEAQLRARDVSAWSAPRREARERLLDTLAAYRRRGVFPRRGVDAYAGRRPRFIDDRGVHCAVGHLVAASGHAALARSIDERFEYAYVGEMDAPALVDWAFDHGFDVAELAMIQPGYSPVPTAESTRRAIFSSADAFTLRCAREHRPPTSVRLSVAGLDDASAAVSTQSLDPFAACFAEQADAIERGGGAYDRTIHTYAFETRVPIRSPQRILEDRVERTHLTSSLTHCTPAPGALVKSARFEVRVEDEGAEAEVSTTPPNADVARCLASYLEERLRDFGPGDWRLRVKGHRDIPPRVHPKWLAQRLTDAGRDAARRCRTTDEAFGFTLETSARVDAERFQVKVRTDDEALRTCVERAVQARLLDWVEVRRRRPDGSFTKFFRIDGDADATASVNVGSKADLERRAKEARERMERDLGRGHL